MASKYPYRSSIRLKGYDYSQPGYYFFTLCIQNRECILGNVIHEEMKLNEYGRIVEICWNDLINHYPNVKLDAFVIMPNHVHGIIRIINVGARSPRPQKPMHRTGENPKNRPRTVQNPPGGRGNPAPTLGNIIAYFKYQSTQKINCQRSTPGFSIWQRNYYEHIIRNHDSLNKIRNYILTNPSQWKYDYDNPDRTQIYNSDYPLQS